MSNQQVVPVTPDYFEKYAAASQRSNIFGRLLLFNKFGEFTAGKQREQIPLGTKLAILMPTLQVGFIRWEANRPVEAWMGFICHGFVPPRRADLGYTDKTQWETFDDGKAKDPIQFSNQVIMVDPNNGDDVFTFATSSDGGLRAIIKLSEDYGKHTRLAPFELPIVTLGRDSYRHPNPQYGEIRIPVFKDMQWVGLDKLPQVVGLPELPGLTSLTPNKT